VSASWCEDLRLPSATLGGKQLNARRREAVAEAVSWPVGTSDEPLRTMLYVRGPYNIGVAKPGKEAERQTESINLDDMLPIVARDEENIEFTPGFTGIFRLLWDLEPRGAAAHALAGLLFHMAYMVSHQEVDGRERLIPPTSVLDEVDAGMPAIIAGSERTLPPSVFVYLLEALALNEDVKYRNHSGWGDGTGRVNTLLTCVNVISWRMQGMHPMEAGGRLSARGVAPISQRQAFELFPCLTGDVS
jgi:hypothetical protein